MKVLAVAGARPQFIKASVVGDELRMKHNEVLVHTGQHFDYNMSGQFFDELGIPEPDYNLGISGGSHAEMTGKMMMSLEKVMLHEQPDWVLVFGDTNSTLAAALAAAKICLPVCHVEAGVRTNSMTNPEEINRICTDHVSTLLLASTPDAMESMKKENLLCKAVFTGDPMFDAFKKYSGKKKITDMKLGLLSGNIINVPDKFYYLTCHREENTKDDKILAEILSAMECLDYKVIYPVHPRNKERAVRISSLYGFKNILLTEPVGYLESICLVNNAEKIITDSGGLQREAFYAGKKCVTILDFITCKETMTDGRNVLCRPEKRDILNKLAEPQNVNMDYQPFGDGYSAKKIVEALENYNCNIN